MGFKMYEIDEKKPRNARKLAQNMKKKIMIMRKNCIKSVDITKQF